VDGGALDPDDEIGTLEARATALDQAVSRRRQAAKALLASVKALRQKPAPRVSTVPSLVQGIAQGLFVSLLVVVVMVSLFVARYR
jgi:hypothetical protein